MVHLHHLSVYIETSHVFYYINNHETKDNKKANFATFKQLHKGVI